MMAGIVARPLKNILQFPMQSRRNRLVNIFMTIIVTNKNLFILVQTISNRVQYIFFLFAKIMVHTYTPYFQIFPPPYEGGVSLLVFALSNRPDAAVPGVGSGALALAVIEC